MHLARILRWLIAAAIAVLGTFASAQSSAPITFANLPKGDTLVISYHQPQCFGYYGAEFSYTATHAPKFVVDRVTLNDPIRVSLGYHHTRLGTVSLEHGEATKLDAFLAACRNPDPRSEDLGYLSPGPPWFRLQQKRGNKVVAEETLNYPSKIYPRECVLSFDEMLRALEVAYADKG